MSGYISTLKSSSPFLFEGICWVIFIILLLFYSRIRGARWRKILGASLDYHKFHLSALQADKSVDEKTREFSQALLWAINKQLPSDLSRKGALWRSFMGEKTSLNTCGTIFYESSRYAKFIDRRIIRLNDTLLSTFYRILFLESIFSTVAVVFMDILFFISIFTRPESGSARLYIEMRRDLRR